MKVQLPFSIPPLKDPIRYTDKILLIGSCFTEHISGRLSSHKFQTLSNPNGILFNPLSLSRALTNYVLGKKYEAKDLFYYNELWNSWDHHTRFSHIEQQAALDGINREQEEAAIMIRKADWIIITLGSAFQYFLTDIGTRESGFLDHPDFKDAYGVFNNHRAPGAWFTKGLLSINEILETLGKTIQLITQHNPNAQILFTISPVRHIRDGLIENNRSKARLIEVVHELCSSFDTCYYFPAYELVIDVLRDYRYYDIDLVHPNYAATESVWEAFVPACIDPAAQTIMQAVKELVIARQHKARFPETEGHRNFLNVYADKVAKLSASYPFLDLSEEALYFQNAVKEAS